MFLKPLTLILILTPLALGGCFGNRSVSETPGTDTPPPAVTQAPNSSPQPANNVLVSSDGQSQVTLPEGWLSDRELHESAEIQASQRGQEMYLIVLSENKEDFQDLTLEQHSEITRQLLVESLSDSQVTGPSEVTEIGEKPAIQYEIRGSVEGVNVAYLHTTVETADRYHQILAWTLPSNFSRSEAQLQAIVQSFREN